jgi:hypothetical protein
MKSRRPRQLDRGASLGSCEMNFLKKRWPLILLLVLVCLGGLGFVVYRELDRQWHEAMESKFVRTSPATVVRKADGRVYYQIDSFENLAEPRTRAAESEAKRLRDSGPRYTYSVDWYNRIETGATVYVRYQCFSNGSLEIVGVDTTRY